MKKLFALSLFVIFMSINAQAVEYYDDGLVHDIDTTINDSISIWNGEHHLPETFTTVNVLSGGNVNYVDVYDQSIVNVFTGGQISEVSAHHESQIVMNNVFLDVGSHVYANDYSHVSMTGGQAMIASAGNSTVEITDATVYLDIQDNGQVTVTDSQIEYFELRMNASLRLPKESFLY